MDRRSLHPIDGGASRDGAAVADLDVADTCTSGRSLTRQRIEGRAAASGMVHGACADVAASPDVATSIGVSASMVKQWANPAEPAAMALGDVLGVAIGGRPEWARDVLSRGLAFVEGRIATVSASTIDRLQRLISREAGTVADEVDRALADNEVTKEEARRVLLALRALRRRVDEAIAKVEALL